MTRINNEAELKEKLQGDVLECGKEKIVIQAGHFPLLYLPEVAIEGITQWGKFSPYSLELGCDVGKFAREIGKDVQFVFFVDDHSYESIKRLGMHCDKNRGRFYREKSGLNAKLHPEYQRIMDKFGFNETDVLRHDHEKPRRENCLYFSEKALRKSKKEIENICAKEYTEFIENPRYFDKNSSYLVSFVPNRCKDHICEVALNEEIEGLRASHIFMETMMPFATKEELYQQGRGVTYRQD